MVISGTKGVRKSRKNVKSPKFDNFIKFIYSEKAMKFCEIVTLLFSYVVPVKVKVS